MSEILSSPIYSSINSNTEHLSVQITPVFSATVNEFTEFSKFYKRNDAQTRMVNLKMIAITLGSIAQWLAHFPSNEEILGFNPFGCNYFVIKFNEFIENLLWKKLD